MSIHYVECPYCEEETCIELESEKAMEDYKEFCDKCEKEFSYYYEDSVNIYPSKIKEKTKEMKE